MSERRKEKRHRIFNQELPEVVAALALHLEKLMEAEDLDKAKTVFNTLYRLTREKKGRPVYPEFESSIVEHYIDYFKPEYP